nr:hypothetical protein CTI12_AA292010 [Tanacetum cinerariifolium]
MIENQRAGAPYGILLAIVVITLIGIPFFLGDGGEAVTDFISELLSPLGLLLLPIVLLLVIQYLSSDNGSFVSGIFNTGEPNSIHRASVSSRAVEGSFGGSVMRKRLSRASGRGSRAADGVMVVSVGK